MRNPRKRNLVARVTTSVSLLLTACGALAATTNGLSDAEIEGRRIVQKILEQKPAEESAVQGVLKINAAKGRRSEVRVKCTVIATATNWFSVYETLPGTNAANPVKFTVVHNGTNSNQYQLELTQPAPDPNTKTKVDLTGRMIFLPFAGSDFGMADLGLEFLHWPVQRLLKSEIKRGQACYVLESTIPDPDVGYNRVKSWLDIDSVQESGQPAIIQAEAYDPKGRLLKEFLPKGPTKVNGQWQVQEIDIYNVQTGSRTSLVFDLDPK